MKKITVSFRTFSLKIASFVLIGGLLLTACEKQVQQPRFTSHDASYNSDISNLGKTGIIIIRIDTAKQQNASALGKTNTPDPILWLADTTKKSY